MTMFGQSRVCAISSSRAGSTLPPTSTRSSVGTGALSGGRDSTMVRNAIGDVTTEDILCFSIVLPMFLGSDSARVPPIHRVRSTVTKPQELFRPSAISRTSRPPPSPSQRPKIRRVINSWLMGTCFGSPVVPEEEKTKHRAAGSSCIAAAGASGWPAGSASQEASKAIWPGSSSLPGCTPWKHSRNRSGGNRVAAQATPIRVSARLRISAVASSGGRMSMPAISPARRPSRAAWPAIRLMPRSNSP